ncbi:2274_t:CDS:2, partial [Ambispora gerdemannii]
MDSLYTTQFYSWIKNPQNREYAALRLRPLVEEYNSLSHTARVLRWIASDWKPSEAKDLFRLVTEKWDEGKRRLLAFFLVRAQREEEGLFPKRRRLEGLTDKTGKGIYTFKNRNRCKRGWRNVDCKEVLPDFMLEICEFEDAISSELPESSSPGSEEESQLKCPK